LLVARYDILLTLPINAGQAIVQAGADIAFPLLGTNQFVKFCGQRGLSVNRECLIGFNTLAKNMISNYYEHSNSVMWV